MSERKFIIQKKNKSRRPVSEQPYFQGANWSRKKKLPNNNLSLFK